MMPLYAARIEDLGQSDFVKVDCAACHHVALLSPEFLLRLGLSPQAKVLDLKDRVRCRGCGAKRRAVVSVKWRAEISRKPAPPLSPRWNRNTATVLISRDFAGSH